MVKKNDAPTEIETITLTMSRPVAEAVQAACEWYLRLHMGQFWDVADDLCMAKFYSDASTAILRTVPTSLTRRTPASAGKSERKKTASATTK